MNTKGTELVHKYTKAGYLICTLMPVISIIGKKEDATFFWSQTTCRACMDVGLGWNIQETTKVIYQRLKKLGLT